MMSHKKDNSKPPPLFSIVSQDCSGNFTTIQATINAVRDLFQVQVDIYIKPGNYHEKLIIPS